MAILLVVVLVLWAVLIVVGFAFEGLLWVAIIAIILFVGTSIVGYLRYRVLKRRATAASGASRRSATTSRSAAPNAAPTAKAQRKDGVVSDDQVNPTGNLE